MNQLEEDLNDKTRNWYIKTYNSLVKTRRELRGWKKKRGYRKNSDYLEVHHIIPKCMGGKNEEDNYVLFTYREHIIAHHLLYRIFPENSGLALAYMGMIYMNPNRKVGKGIYKIVNGKEVPYTTRDLEEIRKKVAERNTLLKTGVKYSEETKKKLSEMRMGHEVKESTRKAISEARVGIVFTEEHKKNISESHRGKTLSEETRKKVSENSITKRRIIGPNGEIYDSVRDCASKLEITIGAMYHKLRKHPEEGYKYESNLEYREDVSNKVLDTNTRIEYNSLTQCAKALGRDKKTIRNWIEKHPEKGFKFID